MQPGYKVKKLTVQPGKSLSKQYHTHRDEYWVVLQGTGELLLDFSNVPEDYPFMRPLDLQVQKGYYIKVDKKVIHKLTNTGNEPLIIIEIQVGETTDEGDIIRLD
jgi:mannose-1-phosphate guanylyltransferase